MSNKKADTAPLMHRYPGIQPFTREYEQLFFGRDRDIAHLLKFINVNKLTVLHGKSGLGKSSLLNAGIIPRLETEYGYRTVMIRFGAYNQARPTTPAQLFLQRLREFKLPDSFIFDLHANRRQPTIWQLFKALEWEQQNDNGILLVLDQFEEVFTYPEGVEEFSRQFSELVFNRMPESLRKEIYEKAETDPGFLQERAGQLDFLDHAPPLKILIGIRSDRLSFLDRMSAYLPNILKNCVELFPLTVEQAREAIANPARRPGRFVSPAFAFDQPALQKMIDYLSQEGKKPVEPFLLQIIAQHIEEEVIALHRRQPAETVLVSTELVGDLDLITQEYYTSIVRGSHQAIDQAGFDPFDQLLIRFLIERNLIDEKNHNRISLDRIFVEQKGISPALLEMLVDARLVRREPNTVSGLSYELSHDTLIDPILNAAEILGALEEQIEHYYRAQIAENGTTNDDDIPQFIENKLVDREGSPRSLAVEELPESGIRQLEALKAKNIVREGHSEKSGAYYELFPMFLPVVLRMRAQREESMMQEKEARMAAAVEQTAQERKKRRRATFIAIGATILTLLAVALGAFALQQRKEATDQRMLAEQLRLVAEAARDTAETARNKEAVLREEAQQSADRARIESDRATVAEQAARNALANLRRVQEETRLANYNSYLEQGKALLAQGNFDAAITNFRFAGTFEPNAPELRKWLAEATRKAENKIPFDSLIAAGDRAYSEDDFTRAIDEYRKAAQYGIDSALVAGKIQETRAAIIPLFTQTTTQAQVLYDGQGYFDAYQKVLQAESYLPYVDPSRLGKEQYMLEDIKSRIEDRYPQDSLAAIAEFPGASTPPGNCYERFRAEGIRFMNLAEYENAITQFNAARYCPDTPRNPDVDALISEVQKRRSQELEVAQKIIQEAEGNADKSRQAKAAGDLAFVSGQYLKKEPAVSFRTAEAAYRLAPDLALARTALLKAYYEGLGFNKAETGSLDSLDLSGGKGASYQIQQDGTSLILYDAGGIEIQGFRAGQKYQQAAITQDGKYLVAELPKNMVLIWPLDPDLLIAEANRQKVRVLTDEERSRFGIK